jgi:uncharacterized membrane protein YidH (DUF202 family)
MDIMEIIGRVNEHIINPLIFLFIMIASVVFAWGLYNFISNADNDEARTKGKNSMVWGIVGIVIMISSYVILAMVTSTFNLDMPF